MVERGRDRDRQGHRLGHAMHGQVARHRIRRGARPAHACRDEGDRGVLGHIEEVRTLEVRVTLLHARRDRAHINDRTDFGIGWGGFIQADGPGRFREHAAHLTEHMLANELRRGVFRIQLPLRNHGNSRNRDRNGPLARLRVGRTCRRSGPRGAGTPPRNNKQAEDYNIGFAHHDRISVGRLGSALESCTSRFFFKKRNEVVELKSLLGVGFGMRDYYIWPARQPV